MRQALSQGLTRRDQRLRDMARALPRPEMLLEAPRQRLDMQGARLRPALIAGVQQRRVRLSDIRGSLRPATLTRTLHRDRRDLNRRAARLVPALQRVVDARNERLQALSARFRPDTLGQEQQRRHREFDKVVARLAEVGRRNLDNLHRKLDAAERLRQTLGSEATLERGFAVVRSDGNVVTDTNAAKAASSLDIQFADGRITVGGRPSSRAKPAKKPPEQGSLF